MADFSERDTLQQEFNRISTEQDSIAQQYNAVTEQLNAGKIGFDQANHARIELKNAQDANNARLAQIHGSLRNVRAKEIDQLRSEIPGWDTEQGFGLGAKRLGEFLKEQGYPDDFLGKATTTQLKNLEELRQRKTAKGKATDFDLDKVSQQRGKKYSPDTTDWDELSATTRLDQRVLKRMPAKQRERFTRDLGPLRKR